MMKLKVVIFTAPCKLPTLQGPEAETLRQNMVAKIN